jgi:hypothetical protein
MTASSKAWQRGTTPTPLAPQRPRLLIWLRTVRANLNEVLLDVAALSAVWWAIARR